MTDRAPGNDFENPHSRPVSPIERQFLAAEPDSAIILQLCASGRGRLSAPDLRAAVQRAGEACPGSRCVTSGERWVDSGRAPEVRVVAPPESGDIGDLAELRVPPGLAAEATCEVVLVDGPDPTVVFRAHHALMDARGVLAWAAAVFACLRVETPTAAADEITDVELVDELGPAGSPPDLGLDWPPLLTRPPATSSTGPLWRRRLLDGTHDGLVAKLMAGLASERRRFLVPVDLRRHAPDLRSTANLVLQIAVDAEPGEDWTALQARVLTALSRREELDMRPPPELAATDLATLRLMVAGLDQLTLDDGAYNASAILSHWGRVDREDYSAPGFRAETLWTLPVVPPGTPLVVDVVETADRTSLSLGWHDGPGVADEAEQLLSSMAEAVWPSEHARWSGNETATEPVRRTVVEQFTEQVARAPEAVALDGPEGPITYAQLDAKADAITATLVGGGIRRGDLVGLMAGRTVDAVAAIWGVLRAGAAYVPLDPLHPDDRIRDLLTDCGARLCLVEDPERPVVPDGCRAVPLREAASSAGEPGRVEVRPDDLAYVIYTSGSTGRPKGVEIEHSALANYAHWAARELEIGPGTRLPWITSLSFDVSGTSLFPPLTSGATTVLVPEEPNHASLRALLVESGATALTLTPSHLELIGRLDLRADGVRTIAVIGEQLRTAVALRAREVFGPKCRILNEYGPTEATIGVTLHEFDDLADSGSAVVPIGRPLDNCTLHFLDSSGRHVPPGETGELCLGGSQLARGYRGRPDLNRERFTHLVDGTRVYRTGDLARILPSGAVEFVGRNDDQVKILGHRIEPAEIAQAAEEHPAVAQAVVLGRQPRPGAAKVLCAYVRAHREMDHDELCEHLASRLPGYMVPSATVVLDSFPQTVNGKVDVLGLPNPFDDLDDRGGAEQDAVAAAVTAVWQRVLHLPPERVPAPDTNFHRLGGDSLSLLAMLAAVAEEVADGSENFTAQLGNLVANPTIEAVAAAVRATIPGTSLKPELNSPTPTDAPLRSGT